VKEEEVAEGSPDHLGDPVDLTETASATSPAPAPEKPASPVVPASLREVEPLPSAEPRQVPVTPMVADHTTSSGTVVLDVEQGGIPVPSFAGKSVRAAIEMAQENGLDLDVVGSGLAQEQSPAAGMHVPSGSKVTVKFGR
jgi:cell division protein FtsI (penicillin-binding protein 3)